ncbi:MAG: hypothetical protein ACRD8Z_14655 [Nitrososphaeraceae archaeon]
MESTNHDYLFNTAITSVLTSITGAVLSWEQELPREQYFEIELEQNRLDA